MRFNIGDVVTIHQNHHTAKPGDEGVVISIDNTEFCVCFRHTLIKYLPCKQPGFEEDELKMCRHCLGYYFPNGVDFIRRKGEPPKPEMRRIRIRR